MAWYYKVGDQEKGPVSKSELQSLIKSKKIGAQSLVRSIEMEDWLPLIDVVRGRSSKSPPSPPPGNISPMDTQPDEGMKNKDFDNFLSEPAGGTLEQGLYEETTPTVPESEIAIIICSQCGRSFPADQIISYDEQMICAACKPLFIQRLKEGATLAQIQTYGGFWIRFLAKVIDGIILGICQWVIMLPFGFIIMSTALDDGDSILDSGGIVFIVIQVFIGISIPLFYNVFFLGRWGATLGKMACGLVVVTPDNQKISYKRAVGRFFAEWISMIALYIGYIIAGFDEEKRSLHDRICSTRVVKK